MADKQKLGILVGGGPAPGINGVIGAVTIEAIERGLEVVGIYDGFKWLCKGDVDHTHRLVIGDVSRIHFQGGSILRTARDSPAKDPASMANVARALNRLELDYLVTIGGDDTAYSSSLVAAEMGGKVRVVHVPKTIDNDLPLPANMPTFGFQTARHVGVGLVAHLMEDARTTGRWYLVVTMGRTAGHLTVGIGKAAGATLSIIAEEFPPGTVTLDQVADKVEGTVIKRRADGRDDGVILIAEGVGDRMDAEALGALPGVEISYDPHGHIELRDIPLGRLLKQRLEERFKERGDKVGVVDLDLGYELRCASPIPFDIEYCRDLGWGAVRYLLSESYAGGAMICLDEGRTRPLPFEQIKDPETGRTRVRLVDMTSETYKVAQDYMIRLQPEDLEDEANVKHLAEIAHMSPDEFRHRFSALAV